MKYRKTTNLPSERDLYENLGLSNYLNENISIKLSDHGFYDEQPKQTVGSSPEVQLLYDDRSEYNLLNVRQLAKKIYGDEAGTVFSDQLGYYKSLYCGHVVTECYRRNGSSGGFGTWLLVWLLEKKIVDGVIHVKPDREKESGVLYSYQISLSKKEIIEGAKTRYYPVELSKVLNSVRLHNKRFAIIGSPATIAAIRCLSYKDQLIRNRIVFTVGLICGHQKSSKFAEYMASQLGVKSQDVLDIDFRFKLEGRPADQYGIKIDYMFDEQLKSVVAPKTELKGQDWGHGFFKQVSSDFSNDVFNETADIVLGDAWLPEFRNEWRGTSILVVRSIAAQNVIDEALQNGEIELTTAGVDEIYASQAPHYRHTCLELPYRINFYKKFGYNPPRIRNIQKSTIPITRKCIQFLRHRIMIESNIGIEDLDRRLAIPMFVYRICVKLEYVRLHGIRKSFQKLMNRII